MAYLWRDVLRRNWVRHTLLRNRFGIWRMGGRGLSRPMAVALHSYCRLSTLSDCRRLTEADPAGARPYGVRARKAESVSMHLVCTAAAKPSTPHTESTETYGETL